MWIDTDALHTDHGNRAVLAASLVPRLAVSRHAAAAASTVVHLGGAGSVRPVGHGGEQVIASSGQPAKLGRPLDWLVIADHSDGMGMVFDLIDGTPNVMEVEQARRSEATAHELGRHQFADVADGPTQLWKAEEI